MHTKLTLHLDNELIEQAKLFASQHDKSVSQIVADYFQMLSRQTKIDRVPPITQSLTGILQNHQVNEEDYKQYLRDKYL